MYLLPPTDSTALKNCLQFIRLTFSHEVVRHLAARLGERENAVGKALVGMVPLVLHELAVQADESEGMNLLSLILQADKKSIRETRNLTEVLALLAGGPTGGGPAAGEDLLNHLFQTTRPELYRMLSSYAGLRQDSAYNLLRLVADVVAAGLGKYAAQQQLGAVRLGAVLGTTKNRIFQWLPADLPRWPGFRRRPVVKATHAVWAAELARPYWVLAAGGAVALGLMMLGTLAWTTAS